MPDRKEAVRRAAWAIVGPDGEIRVNQLRATKAGAEATLTGWHYRIIPVEIRSLPQEGTDAGE